MTNKSFFSGKEQVWIEIIEKGLYLPEKIIKIQGAQDLTKYEDFKGKRVLDNGCGTGWFGKMLQDRNADVTGTDISDMLLEEASKYIKVKKADVTNLPFENNSFDYVLSFMVLMVVKDLNKALSEIHRVLGPEGKLFFGIVHPYSEKWDIDTGLCFQDNSRYNQIEKRKWVFNLTDGRKFDETYIHRPLEHYISMFSKYFLIGKILEPQIPSEFLKDGKYARLEYLLGEATKIKKK